MKNFRIFHLKTFIFLVVKISVYLDRLVLEMLGYPIIMKHNPPEAKKCGTYITTDAQRRTAL